MKKYERPSVTVMEEKAEGVFASSNCYTVTWNIHQSTELGRETYRIQFDADHNASDNHHSTGQVLTINFNQPVSYVSSSGSLVGGDGTSTLSIAYGGYHNNEVDHIGLGNLTVAGDNGVAILSATCNCNHTCDQHDGLN